MNTVLPKSAQRMPVFVPTEGQRNFVAIMAGCRMTHEEICSVIINPRTRKPIDRNTLVKAFEYELNVGRSRIKSLVSSKFYKALSKDAEWAVKFGLRHFNGFQEDNTTIGVEAVQGAGAESTGIRVVFVKPNHVD